MAHAALLIVLPVPVGGAVVRDAALSAPILVVYGSGDMEKPSACQPALFVEKWLGRTGVGESSSDALFLPALE